MTFNLPLSIAGHYDSSIEDVNMGQRPFISNHFHDAPPATIFLSCSCTFAGVCTPLSSSSRVPYTLPSSVCPKSFVCHSYENCRGVGVFLPLWTFTKLLSFVEPPFHRTRFSVLLC